MKAREEEEYNKNKDQIERKIQERRDFLATQKKQLRRKFKESKVAREKLTQAEVDYKQRMD